MPKGASAPAAALGKHHSSEQEGPSENHLASRHKRPPKKKLSRRPLSHLGFVTASGTKRALTLSDSRAVVAWLQNTERSGASSAGPEMRNQEQASFSLAVPGSLGGSRAFFMRS